MLRPAALRASGALARRSTALSLATLLLTAALCSPASAKRNRHEGFSRFPLNLPGIPAAMIPAEVDGDGIEDLVVVIAYTEWGDVASFETAEFDDIEGMVEVMNVVSSLLDRRELRVYPGIGDGQGFGTPLPAIELDTSVHALAAGHPAFPLVAITDAGLAAIRYDAANGSEPLSVVPLVEQPNLYSGEGRFYADLEFLVPLDEDEIPDVLLPAEEGWITFRGTEEGFEPTPRKVALPPAPERRPEGDDEDESNDKGDEREGDERERDDSNRRLRTLPTARDLDGDGRAELVLVSSDGSERAVVYPQLDELRFDAPRIYEPLDEEGEERSVGEFLGDYVYVGPLRDGGPARVVVRDQIERPGDRMKDEIQDAKRPIFRYALHELDADLRMGSARGAFEAIGYTFEGGDVDDDEDDLQIRLPGGFQDLDGDGLEDLVSISLDFSILPLLTRALVLGSISLTMDFHIACQEEDGTFRDVENLDLSGRFKINFRSNTLRHLSQFAGDFDADGRADFVQLGRGREVTIHNGREGCRYPARADHTIRLEEKLLHLGLVRVLDLNADERSDLYVVHPRKKPKDGSSRPVRVDLYLSGP